MVKKPLKRRLGESGVALLMVLGSVAILTTMVVEFAYNSHIAYTMTRNNLDRLKAYYLARSGMGFAKLQVKIEKDIRNLFFYDISKRQKQEFVDGYQHNLRLNKQIGNARLISNAFFSKNNVNATIATWKRCTLIYHMTSPDGVPAMRWELKKT